MKSMWRLAVLVVLGSICFVATCPAEAIFQYWTELQLINLTGYDIKIKKVDINHPDDDVKTIAAGTIIKAEDPDNPSSEPTVIGKGNKYSKGITFKVWFTLVGNEGSQDCYLYINNPYTGNNSITPKAYFPESQCPSIVPEGITDAEPTPLYHNIQLPSSGHKLELVAVLAFEDLFREGDVLDASDQKAAVASGNEQLGQAESERVKFMQETGLSLPGPR